MLSAKDEPAVARAAQVATERLALFAAEHETSPPRHIVCVYFSPSDREPPVKHRERLTRVMTDVQKFFADEIERHGLGRRSVRFDVDEHGTLNFHYVRGKHPAAYYLGRDPRKGYEIRDDAKAALANLGIDDQTETVIYFCDLRTEKDGKTTGIGPYYGSGQRDGVFRSGRCWFTDASILDPLLLSDAKTMLDDEEYGKISVGKYNSIFIGGAAHELGHGLGLPHTRERRDEAKCGTSLMGSGNRTYGEDRRGEGRGSFLVLADALRLASHPIISGTMRDVEKKPECRLEDVKEELLTDSPEKRLRISGRIAAAVEPYALIAYNDPEGNSDYNATSWPAQFDAENRFTVEIGEFVPGAAELRLVVCHVNGATTVIRRPLTVGADGLPVLKP